MLKRVWMSGPAWLSAAGLAGLLSITPSLPVARAADTPATAAPDRCAAIKAPVDRALCSNPDLARADAALTAQDNAALAGQPADKVAALKAAQQAWRQSRARLCPVPPASAAGDAVQRQRFEACLAGLYAKRRTELTAAGGPAAAPVAAPAAPTPTAAVATAAPPRTDPVPPPVDPVPPAVLARASLPAAGDGEAMLRVDRPGRFAIRAESKTGVSLQLADMITGPTEISGGAGLRDGRLDLLLDVGQYKIRSRGAAEAAGEAALVLTPFREMEPAGSTLPAAAALLTRHLSDYEQRSFWVTLGETQNFSVEAAGQALQDLRLWDAKGALLDVRRDQSTIEARLGRPMSFVAITGTLPAGRYRVTAYGGPPLIWGDGSSENPVVLRAGRSQRFVGPAIAGRIGPLGVERFVADRPNMTYRLDLPQAATARLTVIDARGTRASAELDKTAREPVAILHPAANAPQTIEIAGAEGQPFRLRGLATSQTIAPSDDGNWLGLDVLGDDPEEVPLTALLVQRNTDDDAAEPKVVAQAGIPELAEGKAWHQHFNLRGDSSLLVNLTDGMRLSVRATGPTASYRLVPLLASDAQPLPNVDGETNLWEADAGYYSLQIVPKPGQVGVLDLVLGDPAVKPPAETPATPAGLIDFGVRAADYQNNFRVLSNRAPRLELSPQVVKLPFTVAAIATRMALRASAKLAVPVLLPRRAGRVSVTELDGSVVPVTVTEPPPPTPPPAANAPRPAQLEIAAAGRDRQLLVAWVVDPPRPAPAPAATANRAAPPAPAPAPTAPVPAAAPPPALPALALAEPLTLDLVRDRPHRFTVEIAEGGLHRIESQGRLRIAAQIGTDYTPDLAHAQENGPGHNAVIQTYLRPGHYQLMMVARRSDGHAGLVIRPGVLKTAGALPVDGSQRLTLSPGVGGVVPIEIAAAGRYRLELVSLGHELTARLEDEGGWPVARPGPLTRLERDFEPGRYRLVLMPEAVEARAVLRLTRIQRVAPPEGHGPHPLPFERTVRHQWREPADRDQPRMPDDWRFSLRGDADCVLEISDGAVAELLVARRDNQGVRPGAKEDDNWVPVGKFVDKSPLSRRLPAGDYQVAVRSLGRNDRLDYRLDLRSREIQPDLPRRVSLPATVPFALAQPGVVSLTSFGDVDVRAVLRDAEGAVIERQDDRTDDWNIGLVRRLPAGRYQLDLAATPRSETDALVWRGNDRVDDDGSTNEDTAEAASPPPATASGGPSTELLLSLPPEGGLIERPLDPPAAGSLLLVAAESTAELALSLERRGADGQWRRVAGDQGRQPVAAAIGDGDAGRPWRLLLLPVDGGKPAIAWASRALPAAPETDPAKLAFAPVTLDGLTFQPATAAWRFDAGGLARLSATDPDLLAGSAPGRALTPSVPLIAAEQPVLWLLARHGAAAASSGRLPTLAAASLSLAGADLVVPGDGALALAPPLPDGDRLRLWLARAGFGQAGLDGGRGMGVAEGSSLALAGGAALRIWNAEDADSLKLTLAARDVAQAPPRPASTPVTTALAGMLPGLTAQPMTLPNGAKRLRFDLAAGSAAILNWRTAKAVTLWSGDQPLSRVAEGDWTDLLLVNVTGAASPFAIAPAPVLDSDVIALAPGVPFKRFLGAGGSFTLPVTGDQPAHLRLRGAGASAVLTDAQGRVRRGTDLAITGAGRVDIRHGPGLLVAWLDPDQPAKPAAPATAQAVSLPSALALSGAAMTLRLDNPAPLLLHARASSPALVGLNRDGRREPPQLFPDGVVFHRYLPAGPAELVILPPQDGGLTGSLELTATPVQPLAEGSHDPMILGPGDGVLFGFETTRTDPVGLGLRALPDRLDVRLLDEQGAAIGRGPVQLQRLKPGRYIIDARNPPTAPTVLLTPRLFGVTPPPAEPPAEIAQHFLELSGLGPDGLAARPPAAPSGPPAIAAPPTVPPAPATPPSGQTP